MLNRDVDDVLRADLRALAGQVEVGPLDLPALRATARGRVRRRRTLLAVPLVCAVLLAVVLVALPRHQPSDSLVPAAQPTSGASWDVTARTSTPSTAGDLRVRADPAAAPLSAGHPGRLHLIWTNSGTGPLPFAYPGYAKEVGASRGAGVLGVTDGRCARWDDDGRLVDHSCPAVADQVLPPGGSTTSDLVVADVVSTGRAAPGTYRFTLPTGAAVVLTVSVARPSQPVVPVPVTGQVIADHGHGVVLVGRGPVAATVRFTRLQSGATSVVVSPDGRFEVLLAPGSYQVETQIRDGYCTGVAVDVAAGGFPLEIHCTDGVSTF